MILYIYIYIYRYTAHEEDGDCEKKTASPCGRSTSINIRLFFHIVLNCFCSLWIKIKFSRSPLKNIENELEILKKTIVDDIQDY
jgi:hypothetical protein